jgi:non-ribosomal peptide synthetase component F
VLAFDIAYLEIFLPLLNGARLVLAESGATVMQATPSIWQIICRTGWYASQRLMLLCGGKVLTPELACQLRQGRAPLWNLYGPRGHDLGQCRLSDRADDLPGQPLNRMQLYLLDSAFAPSCRGEVSIGGTGLARSYLGRPDLTAERFLPHPFSCVPGQCLSRTGDLARALEMAAR